MAEATTPDEKTALYYSFIKVYRDAPEQDPLNRLAAFVMGHERIVTVLKTSPIKFRSQSLETAL